MLKPVHLYVLYFLYVLYILRILGAHFPQNALQPRMGVLEVRARVPVKRERLLPTEYDVGGAVVREIEIFESADADSLRDRIGVGESRIFFGDDRSRALLRFVEHHIERDGRALARAHRAFGKGHESECNVGAFPRSFKTEELGNAEDLPEVVRLADIHDVKILREPKVLLRALDGRKVAQEIG